MFLEHFEKPEPAQCHRCENGKDYREGNLLSFQNEGGIIGETPVLSPGDFSTEQIRKYGESSESAASCFSRGPQPSLHHCITASHKIPGNQVGNLTHQLVDMALEIEMNRAFVYQCAYHYARGEDVTKEISMLKISSAEMVNRVAYKATQIYGGYGFMAEYEVARLYADLRPVTIAGGTTEIMKGLVARYMGI